MRNFLMEINIVSQNENLLNIVAVDFMASIVRIVVTNLNHLSDQSTDDEQCSTIHTGYRVINNNNFIFYSFTIKASFHKVIVIQECNKVSFTFAQFFCNSSIRPNNLICICYSVLCTKMETFKTRIIKQNIDAIDSGLSIHNLFV